MSFKESFLSVKPRREAITLAGVGECFIAEMTGAERDDYESEQFKQNGKSVEINRKNARARLIVKTVVDADGNRIFTDSEVEAVGNRPASLLDPIFEKSLQVNGFSKKDVDELVKN